MPTPDQCPVLPGSLQAELATTRRLLADLGIGTEEHRQTLVLLAELRDMTKQKDLELQRWPLPNGWLGFPGRGGVAKGMHGPE